MASGWQVLRAPGQHLPSSKSCMIAASQSLNHCCFMLSSAWQSRQVGQQLEQDKKLDREVTSKLPILLLCVAAQQASGICPNLGNVTDGADVTGTLGLEACLCERAFYVLVSPKAAKRVSAHNPDL